MKELLEYRKALIDRLLQVAHEFRDECLAAKDPFAALDGGWNIHQIAMHTHDVDKLVYASRVRRTAEEDNPEFPNFDGEAHMREHDPSNRPLPVILDDFVNNVEELAQMLHDLSIPAWSRVSRHATLGHGFTLQTWVERDLAHIKEHLEEVRKWNRR